MERQNQIWILYNIFLDFLDHKRSFVSFPVPIKDILYRQDCKILKAITSADNHLL